MCQSSCHSVHGCLPFICSKHLSKQSAKCEAHILSISCSILAQELRAPFPLEWWYANAKLGIPRLVIYVWSTKLPPTLQLYCSHVRDQSAAFVVACLLHLRTQVALGSYKQHVMFADVGSHFRSGYTSAFWAADVLEHPGVEDTRRLSFPEGHGKGMCDAQGGRMEHVLKEETNTHEISTNARQAKLYEAQSPASARSIYYDFAPPGKAELLQNTLDTKALHKDGMAIRSNYFWRCLRVHGHPAMRRHTLASHSHDKTCRPPMAPAIELKDPTTELEPEKAHVQLGTLQHIWNAWIAEGLRVCVGTREACLGTCVGWL